MPEAIPELVWFALLLFLFAVVYVCRKFIEAMFNPIIAAVGKIPLLGDALAGALHSVEQSISNALGHVENGIDGLMGASWHRTAQLMSWLWREIKGHVNLLLQIASFIPILATVVAALRALVHHSVHVNTGTAARVKTLERELHGIEHKVKTIERDLSKGIGHDLRKHVKALDKELHYVEDTTIPAIQADVTTADSAISNLYEWAKGKASLLGVGTFAYAVGVALSALGLGAIRCPSLGNMFRSRGCGLWNGLEDLLGLFIDAFLLTNVCELLPLLETAVSDVADPVVVALTDIGAGLCSGGIGAPPTLQVPALSLPATPGVTLNLP